MKNEELNPATSPLRILIVGKFYPEGMALHIAETLTAMCHAVETFEVGFRHGHGGSRLRNRLRNVGIELYALSDRVPALRERRARPLLDAATAFAADLILVTYDFLLPDEVEALKRRTGAQVVMWFPDAVSNLGRMAFLDAPYDALFFKDPYIVHTLDGVASAPAFYLPEAFNPARHRLPVRLPDLAPYRCDVTTAGNLHAHRVAVFRHLAEFDVKIWGAPPPAWLNLRGVGAMFQGRYVAYEEKAVAFTAAKIVVNTLYPSEIEGVNVRAFEAAGVGAFQLIDWRPGLHDLFEDRKEIVSYRGMPDLVEKVRYYLERPDERTAIAAAGKARAHREHTYGHRLHLLLETVAGRAAGAPIPPPDGHDHSEGVAL